MTRAGLIAGGMGLATIGAFASAVPSSASVTRAASSPTYAGSFHGLNGKSASGTVIVSGTSVMLSGFTVSRGPDLHVYLANGTTEAAVAAGKQLGKVTYKSGETFSLAGASASKYTTVVIHCDKAKVAFGAASLSA
jgi:hypothetical protein